MQDTRGAHLECNPWIGWKITLPPSTCATIEQTLRRYVGTHEALRTGFEVVGEHVIRRKITGNPAWEGTLLAETTTPEETFDVISTHLNRTVRPVGWPNYGFVTIEHGGETPSTTLIGAFDHVIYDGVSAYAALVEIPRLHDMATADDASPFTTPSHNDHAHAQACGPVVTASCDELGKWRRIIKNGNLASLPRASGVARDDALPLETRRAHIATCEQAGAFSRLMQRDGIKEGAAFCAVLLEAISRLGDKQVDFLLSTHGRPGKEWLNSVGWFASLVPIAVDMTAARDVRCVARLLQEEQRETAGSTPLAAVAEVLDLPLQPSLVVSYMKASAFPGSDQWGKRKEKAVIANPPPSSQMHVWLSLMHDGLVFDVRYPKNACSTAWVNDITAHMHHIIDDAVRAS